MRQQDRTERVEKFEEDHSRTQAKAGTARHGENVVSRVTGTIFGSDLRE